jgi:hypothetical protein
MTAKLSSSLCVLGVAMYACGGTDSRLGPGDVVWSSSVRELVIANEGGGLLPSPPKSECVGGSSEYSLSIPSLTIDSWRCEGVGNAPFKKVARTRVITQADLQVLAPTLEKLLVVDTRICGADKPALTLRITDASSTVEYRDSFYGCFDDPRPQIDTNALEELFGKLTVLVLGA